MRRVELHEIVLVAAARPRRVPVDVLEQRREGGRDDDIGIPLEAD
jgi:hypothetical protein